MRGAYPATVGDRHEAPHGSAGQAAGCRGLRLAQLRVSGQEAPASNALKTTTNSRNRLLVSYYLRSVRDRHRDQPPTAASHPGGTGREQAMVLTGLIIIAVVLTALMVPGVPGIQRKLPAPMPAAGPDRAAPGYPGVTS
jgi:hypothetical protein